MGEDDRRSRRGRRPGKLIVPGGGVAKHIADLALLTGLDPLSLMRTPPEVVRALYDGAKKLSERRRARHG